MTPSFSESFKQNYQGHLQRLKLNGLQPKTIDTHSRAENAAIDLSAGQNTDYGAKNGNAMLPFLSMVYHQIIRVQGTSRLRKPPGDIFIANSTTGLAQQTIQIAARSLRDLILFVMLSPRIVGLYFSKA